MISTPQPLGESSGVELRLERMSPHESDLKAALSLANADLKETDQKYRDLLRKHVLSPLDDVRDLAAIEDDGTLDVCHEVFRRVRDEMRSTRCGRVFYARIELRGCEFLPLKSEGNWGDVVFCASYLPEFSRGGDRMQAVYEVTTRRA